MMPSGPRQTPSLIETPPDDDAVARARARFDEHRRAWDANPALRTLYGRWYAAVRARLPPPALGPWIELGSGPGFARDTIPELELTDLVPAPWHARRADAEALPYDDGSVGALVLFDVLHHVPRPARFFAEATRVLRPGGRIVLCEPYISLASYPVYKLLHEEPVRLFTDPFAGVASRPDDPFDSNQALPTEIFGRHRAALASRFPALDVVSVDPLAGFAYPASGGFSRGPLLPMPLWRRLLAVEDALPAPLFRWLGFRLLAVVQKRAP
jgi:SAM-dependent methyltransferase